MNFLKLCQRVRESSGVTDSGPTSVLNQTGKLGRIVSFVRQADLDIQNEAPDFRFLWRSVSGATIPNLAIYNPADFGITDVSRLSLNQLKEIEIDDNFKLTLLEWDAFKRETEGRNITSFGGRPALATVNPEGKIKVFPSAAKAHNVNVEYYRTPKALENNTDVSLIPERFHEIIVQQALIYYGQFEQDPEIINTATLLYSTLLGGLFESELPRPHVSGTMFL